MAGLQEHAAARPCPSQAPDGLALAQVAPLQCSAVPGQRPHAHPRELGHSIELQPAQPAAPVLRQPADAGVGEAAAKGGCEVL